MSDSIDVCFTIYHNGKFEVSVDNTISYKGGEILELASPPQMLFTNLPEALGVSLYMQRIWYKLPFEDFTELKLMCNENAMFQKMVQSTKWIKTVEIFMEKEDVADGNGNSGGSNFNTVASGHGDRACSDDGDRAANTDDEMLDEDARVEQNVAGFVDEEEHDNSEDTPQNSDCEDGGRQYQKCKKGSESIKLGQVFDNISEFKEAVVDYALKNGYNVKFTRWGSKNSEVRCAVVAGVDGDENNGADGDVNRAAGAHQFELTDIEKKKNGCQFRIYCSFEKSIGMYLIKIFNDEHSCIPDGYSKVLKDEVIAKLFLNEIRSDPTLKAKAMQAALEEKYNLVVSNDQCRKARKKALKMIQDEHDEQFSRIKDYKVEIIRSNLESTVEVKTITNESGIETFDIIYVCLAALRRTWLAHCRPIFGIDGCFLKNDVKGQKGQLLAAVGRDANNQFFLVAWTVVQVENTETWLWFIQKLKHDLILMDGEGFTLISDRQKGLLIAVEQELPRVEHRMCARHIYGNLRRVYPGKELPKDLFWAVAKSFNIGDYEKAIKALKEFDLGVHEAVMMKNPRNCSRAFFNCTSLCEDVSNNFSESYNNTINKAREMPLVEMLETVRRLAMIRMDTRKNKAFKWQGKYSEKVANTIKEEKKYMFSCRVIPSGNGQFEVSENNHGFTVDMVAKTCACRRWNMTDIPCRHALRVILKKKLDPLDFVSHWYLTSTWRNQYSDPICPVNGINFWRTSGEAIIQPPPREDARPTKKQKKRIKGKNESPQKKKKHKQVQEPQEKQIKLSIEERTSHCGRCGHSGHNSRRCPNHGCPIYRPKKQLSGFSQGEGPSQQSQPSQNSHFN